MPLKSLNLAIDNRLSARLDMPDNREILGYAIISHCFTCSKETLTTARVSRGLAKLGFAVIRFDFTGLGESSGEFSDSNFTSMVKDIEAVAQFMEHHYQPPDMLIGHSMGGTASLVAAAEIPSCKTVVTIASPSSPQHVLHHFGSAMPELAAGRASEIKVAGNHYPVKPQFIHDVRSYPTDNMIDHLSVPVLAIRAGQDALVATGDADEILKYTRGKAKIIDYPNADHLFSSRNITDAMIDQIANWYLHLDDQATSD
ncbi:MAG: lysophospholipase [Gammaproteobacteria bacterium]|nr:lysophospholipase [Gammaproteobacteria bacterium]